MLKVFIFSYPGVYLTGYAVVLAENEEQAFDILKPILIKAKLPTSDIKQMGGFLADRPTGRIVWDGDY